MSFFKQLGFKFNPQFTDHTAACMVIADDFYAMLLTHAKFKMLTKKEIADTTRFTEVLTALSFESKAQVSDFVDTALKAGAIETRKPQNDGSMYGRSFDDLDGHTWEIFWMDPNHIQKTDCSSSRKTRREHVDLKLPLRADRRGCHATTTTVAFSSRGRSTARSPRRWASPPIPRARRRGVMRADCSSELVYGRRAFTTTRSRKR